MMGDRTTPGGRRAQTPSSCTRFAWREPDATLGGTVHGGPSRREEGRSVMHSRRAITMAVPFDLAHEVVGLERTSGSAWFIDGDGSGPPRNDGYTVGAPAVRGDSPHNGEMHPDADELLYIVSGRVRVHLELPGGDRTVAVA